MNGAMAGRHDRRPQWARGEDAVGDRCVAFITTPLFNASATGKGTARIYLTASPSQRNDVVPSTCPAERVGKPSSTGTCGFQFQAASRTTSFRREEADRP